MAASRWFASWCPMSEPRVKDALLVLVLVVAIAYALGAL